MAVESREDIYNRILNDPENEILTGSIGDQDFVLSPEQREDVIQAQTDIELLRQQLEEAVSQRNTIRRQARDALQDIDSQIAILDTDHASMTGASPPATVAALRNILDRTNRATRESLQTERGIITTLIGLGILKEEGANNGTE